VRAGLVGYAPGVLKLEPIALDLEEGAHFCGVAFTPDSRTLVVGQLARPTPLRTLSAWDTASWRRRWTVPTPDAPIAVAVARDGPWIATAHNTQVWLWDVDSGARLRTLGDRGTLWAPLTTLPGERVLVSFRPEGQPASLSIWDARSGTPLAYPASFAGDDFVSSFAVDPSAERVATFARGSLALWDLVSDRKLHDFGGAVGTFPYPSARMPIVFHPAGDRVIAGGIFTEEGPVVFDAATGHKIVTLHNTRSPTGASALAVSPCGRWLVGAFGWQEGDHQEWKDLGLRIWDLEKRTRLERIRMDGRPIEHLVFSPDGSVLAASSIDRLDVWRARTDP